MFSSDRFAGLQWLSLALLVDSGHTEVVLLAFLQSHHLTLRGSAELTDRLPDSLLLITFLHNIVADGAPTVVLG